MTKRSIVRDIQALIWLFEPHCQDKETLEWLQRMIEDRGSWPKARNLFHAVREKNLKCENRADRRAQAQYAFEENCAKTLYNLTQLPAPYDADAPYWIIPCALKLAEELGLSQMDVIGIVGAQRSS